MKLTSIVCIAALAAAVAASARAEVLITRDEAARPDAKPIVAPAIVTRAGVTRAPEAIFESPTPAGPIKSPVHFKIKLVAHNGAKVDLSSVSVLYLKDPLVDLTPRLRRYLQPSGVIDMPAAEIPPGEHLIAVELTDSMGHKSRPAPPFRIEIKP